MARSKDDRRSLGRRRRAAASMEESSNLRSWQIAMGIVPGALLLASIGMALTGIYFWLWIVFAYASIVWLAADLWLYSRQLKVRVASYVSVVLLFVLVSYIAFKPAPIRIDFTSGPGDYPNGTDIAGVRWSIANSEAQVYVFNDTDYDYTNFDIILQTDLSIAGISIDYRLGKCDWDSAMPDMYMTVTGENGRPYTVRPTPHDQIQPITPTRRVYCDRLTAKTEIKIDLALVALSPIVNGQLPLHAIKPRENPKWIIAQAKYDAGHTRHVFESHCFLGPCNGMPRELFVGSSPSFQAIEIK